MHHQVEVVGGHEPRWVHGRGAQEDGRRKTEESKKAKVKRKKKAGREIKEQKSNSKIAESLRDRFLIFYGHREKIKKAAAGPSIPIQIKTFPHLFLHLF